MNPFNNKNNTPNPNAKTVEILANHGYVSHMKITHRQPRRALVTVTIRGPYGLTVVGQGVVILHPLNDQAQPRSFTWLMDGKAIDMPNYATLVEIWLPMAARSIQGSRVPCLMQASERYGQSGGRRAVVFHHVAGNQFGCLPFVAWSPNGDDYHPSEWFMAQSHADAEARAQELAVGIGDSMKPDARSGDLAPM